MKLTSIIGLIGVGYMINEGQKRRPYKVKYRANPNLPSYSEYFREVLINKLDILFYGGPQHSKWERNNYSRKLPYRTPEYRPPNYSKFFRNYKVDDIYFETEEKAKEVLDTLIDFVNKYDKVTVADYYELSDHSFPVNCTDNKYGWTNLDYVEVRESLDGNWYIDLEEPEYFD